MDFQQQRGVHLPRNAPPAEDAFPAPQHPQSAPSSFGRPVPIQQRGYTGVVRDPAVFQAANAAGDNRLDEDWECMPPPAENIAAQGQFQDLRYVDMGLYDRPMIAPHCMSIAITLSTTMPGLLRVSPPMCRLPYQPPSTYLTTQLGTLRLALLEASSMKCLTRALSPMG
ncbi:hypothetical protein BJV77DRAFT_641507 [Russula vinacea]|nr:hypothetical protein BJV77DRAFT_641507 [Russula vinacea]